MHTQNLIERLLEDELKGLCNNCALASHCTYRMATHKIIIQCELHQWSEETNASSVPPTQQGLCKTCCQTESCKLPEKHTGIWHCKAYV